MLRKTLIGSEAPGSSSSASMRPQRNAAENHEAGGACLPHAEASMRPQRNAAENHGRARIPGAGSQASMRPQRNAAENLIWQEQLLRILHCASMRPQRNAAENAKCFSVLTPD